MTYELDVDQKPQNQPFLPFGSSEINPFSIRVRPSEFARLMNCTKQAVSQWVKEGKITLGADGRLDPQKAVNQLLRNSDPARLRARILMPLMRDVGVYQKRIAELEHALAEANESIEFNEGAFSEINSMVDKLRRQFALDWSVLRGMPEDHTITAFNGWLDYMEMYCDNSGAECPSFMEFMPGADDSDENEVGGEVASKI